VVSSLLPSLRGRSEDGFQNERAMTALQDGALRQLAESVLTRTEGARADSTLLGPAARRAYQHLAHLLTPIIGQAGTTALTVRAVHLARREHAWLTPVENLEQTDEVFEYVAASLERQDPDVALKAGAAVLATLAELLVAFIGESLTMRLLRKAWPDAFSDAGEEG
jgi:hypothetical protein